MIHEVEAFLKRFAAEQGARVRSASQRDIEPTGDGFIVGVRAELATADGVRSTDVYIDTSTQGVLASPEAALTDSAGRNAIAWEYPADPALPALTAMSFPEAAGQTLSKFGVEASGAVLTLEAYRPGKRAVFRIDTAQERYFAKVVRPSAAAEIDALHQAFLSAGVHVPESLGHSSAGLLLLRRLLGENAAAHIRAIAAGHGFLDGLAQLSDAMSRVPLRRRARQSLAIRADWYAERMREQIPHLAPEAAAVIPLITHRYAADPPGHPVTIHGDLHLGQLFVDPAVPTRILGVLDIDTAGLGDPADDYGALYGHIRVSAAETEAVDDVATAQAYSALASSIVSGFTGSRVRAIAATHLIGHALAVGSRGTAAGHAVAAGLVAEAREMVG